jgi:hypothetical protein
MLHTNVSRTFCKNGATFARRQQATSDARYESLKHIHVPYELKQKVLEELNNFGSQAHSQEQAQNDSRNDIFDPINRG